MRRRQRRDFQHRRALAFHRRAVGQVFRPHDDGGGEQILFFQHRGLHRHTVRHACGRCGRLHQVGRDRQRRVEVAQPELDLIQKIQPLPVLLGREDFWIQQIQKFPGRRKIGLRQFRLRQRKPSVDDQRIVRIALRRVCEDAVRRFEQRVMARPVGKLRIRRRRLDHRRQPQLRIGEIVGERGKRSGGVGVIAVRKLRLAEPVSVTVNQQAGTGRARRQQRAGGGILALLELRLRL